MSGRERRRLVEEEELGPAPTCHRSPAPTFVVAEANDPGLRGPAPGEQGPRRGIVNDPAVAGEEAAGRNGEYLTKGRDAVRQGHRRAARILASGAGGSGA